MCDQLRWDYLSCTGHPTLKTPNIDWLAENGVRFSNAYAQSPICGPSRMSYYTGRYVSSHGSSANDWPLNVGEKTLGDHLTVAGMRTVLCGKTHMTADREGMQRLGIDPKSKIGARVSECGFEIWERHEGLYPDPAPEQSYNRYLAEKGYDAENPWHDNANSGRDDTGTVRSGWFLKNASFPAEISPEHSETPYIVDRTIEFVQQAGPTPWLLHCSFIKPHWPLVASPPYHDMYGVDDVIPPVRSEAERADPHPVFGAYMQHNESLCYSNDKVRNTAVPVYMGLVKQIDDEVGRLIEFLRESGRLETTMIVFGSDHGDYLGDHWLGEKDLFHDPAVKVPLVIYDPDAASDMTRGTTCEALVEAIDLAPTFVEYAGGTIPHHVLEGRSLMPYVNGLAPENHRDAVFSEYDYVRKPASSALGRGFRNSRLYMVRTERWKGIFGPPFRPMLFDLHADPDELVDLGDRPPDGIIEGLRDELLDWSLSLARSPAATDGLIRKHLALEDGADGIFLGIWSRDLSLPE